MGQVSASDTRSADQQAFDANYEDDETVDDADWYERRRKLSDIATRLAPNDPRQIDLAFEHTINADRQADTAQFDALIQQGKEGVFNSVDDMVERELRDTTVNSKHLAPDLRAAALHAAITHAEAVAPGRYAPTVNTRLREAEAIDQGGETARAEQILNEVRRHVEFDEHCRCHLHDVIAAQVWLSVVHAHFQQAERILFTSPYADEIRKGTDALVLDYAWVQLIAGQTQAGLATMRNAAYTHPDKTARPPQQPYLILPLDLAYALDQAGLAAEARSLLTREATWECQARQYGDTAMNAEPWQQIREDRLQEIAAKLCPPARKHVAP